MLRYAAAERNIGPIGDVLAHYLQNGMKILELASGTGQQSAALADRFPQVTFQPSEVDPRLIHSIVGYVDHHRVVPFIFQSLICSYQFPNLRVPLHIDVTSVCTGWALPSDLRPGSVDAILVVNLLHISDFAATNGVFEAASSLLRPDGILVVYGPFSREGSVFPESNRAFDRSLREQNPQWGLRDTRQLRELGISLNLTLVEQHEMPANNLTIVFRKR
ncbi:hypothetical protein PENTCL1PPCAC_25103 [Pristionchus entomophagus]|uniref:Methyltransferase n=1 Tax=Pristionchus entomophagus TaxID=358040 RepID=A0AAV5U7U5_9BILA|nr:hypothetical protein PENTCL1PPCAC_25103 [Pristionchus entomophagus]